MDPDLDPGGLKTYGSYGSGAGAGFATQDRALNDVAENGGSRG